MAFPFAWDAGAYSVSLTLTELSVPSKLISRVGGYNRKFRRPVCVCDDRRP